MATCRLHISRDVRNKADVALHPRQAPAWMTGADPTYLDACCFDFNR